MEKYSRQHILEAISYWESELAKLDEGGPYGAVGIKTVTKNGKLQSYERTTDIGQVLAAQSEVRKRLQDAKRARLKARAQANRAAATQPSPATKQPVKTTSSSSAPASAPASTPTNTTKTYGDSLDTIDLNFESELQELEDDDISEAVAMCEKMSNW